MKKLLVNYGGILFFYLVVALGVLSLCSSSIWNKPNTSGISTSTVLSKK